MLFDILSRHTTRSEEIAFKKIIWGPFWGQVLAEAKKLYHSFLGHITPINMLFDIGTPKLQLTSLYYFLTGCHT